VWNSLVKSDETGQTHWHPPETMNTMALLDRLLQRVQIYCHRNEEPEFYQFASWPLHYEHTTFGFSIIPLGHIAPAAHVISRGSSLGAFGNELNSGEDYLTFGLCGNYILLVPLQKPINKRNGRVIATIVMCCKV